MLDLPDEKLMFTKYDLLFGKKKLCYIQLLYDYCINLYIKLRNKKNSLISNIIFVEHKEKNNS